MARVLKFRARSRDGYFQDHIFDVSIFPKRQHIPIGDHHIRQRVEIEGIDVTARLTKPGVTFQNALDLVRINKHIVSDCNIPLRNDDGFFRNDIPHNFWQSNDLHPSGFLNRVEVFVEFLIDEAWQSFLFFQGQITALQMPLSPTSTLRCFSNTARLRQFELERSGVGIEKIAELTTSDAASKTPVVEGMYISERGLAPLTAGAAPEAYHHQDPITLKAVVNDALGIKDNTGYLSASDLKTQGGILEDPILLNFKTAYRYRRVRDAFETLTKIENSVISFHPDFEDLPEVDPHISVRGNIGFNTEVGRITRLPTDWIYSPFSKSLYVLLSNPEHHISDQLVEYRLESDSYHVLHEFDSNLTCYRLASADFDTFYILCGASTDLDGSDPESADSERFALGLDSSVEPSEIQILTYIKSEGWVETFIDANSTSHRPQLGIHYHVGFANRDFAWQGNAPSRYSAFLMHDGYLYYRYATETEFGVAQADMNGNTTVLFTAAKDGYENHLNFAFTFGAAGSIYFAWTQGTGSGSTLNIERYDGSETTEVLKIRRSILELSDRRAADGGGSLPAGNGLRAGSFANPRLSAAADISEDAGAFLGVHEIVYSDGFLYMVVPVVRGNRDIDKSAGSVLYLSLIHI